MKVGRVMGKGVPTSASPAPEDMALHVGVTACAAELIGSIGRFVLRLLITEGDLPGLVKKHAC